MTLRFNRVVLVALLGSAFVSPQASAFTFEDGKGNTIPKFDLEEQARQFRKPETDLSAANKKGVETPFGNLQFGVQRNDSPFGYRSPFASGFAPGPNADRRHYERLFTPEYLQGGGRGE
jgi:hypothetical protein